MGEKLFEQSHEWYEKRAICFDAEAGYNTLKSPTVTYYGQSECESIKYSAIEGRCLGVFLDSAENQTLAAYIATDEGVFLVKNPMQDEHSIAGKTNAIRFNDQGELELYYHQQGRNWKFGRKVKMSEEQGDPNSEVETMIDVLTFDDNFPGLEYIRPVGSASESSLSGIISELNSAHGYNIQMNASLDDVLAIVSEASGSSRGVNTILERLTNLYLQQ
ncbi:MAG: hypothetical protein QY314_01515 [Candidatus Dojkabacteria bacterium]|nr:MAG: hypothetical protein QY314_01515 [Candidatus Dojkabacteria bacterium]